MGVGGVRI